MVVVMVDTLSTTVCCVLNSCSYGMVGRRVMTSDGDRDRDSHHCHRFAFRAGLVSSLPPRCVAGSAWCASASTRRRSPSTGGRRARRGASRVCWKRCGGLGVRNVLSPICSARRPTLSGSGLRVSRVSAKQEKGYAGYVVSPLCHVPLCGCFFFCSSFSANQIYPVGTFYLSLSRQFCAFFAFHVFFSFLFFIFPPVRTPIFFFFIELKNFVF